MQKTNLEFDGDNLGSESNQFKENEIIFIPAKTKHSLENNNSLTLIVIEMWYGDILDENDIERFEDIYGRI